MRSAEAFPFESLWRGSPRRRSAASVGARCVLAGLMAQSGLACAPPPATPKLLAIGLDGIRPDVLAEVDTPHLDALAAAGAFSSAARTGSPTVSGPGWSSFLIGVWPDKHGVVSNDFSTNRYGRYPDFLTRLEAVNPSFRTAAVVDWTPLGDSVDGGPLLSPAIDSLIVLDGYELGWLEADSLSGEIAADLLESTDVDALFLYLGAADELSHQSGSIGPEYRGAIAAADRIVGRVMDAVRRRPALANERWLVIMSSDHGRTAEGGHGGETDVERTIPFLLSGPGVSGNLDPAPSVVDVAVTALVHLGVTLRPEWELDGSVRGISPETP